jgi:hypothetical protein
LTVSAKRAVAGTGPHAHRSTADPREGEIERGVLEGALLRCGAIDMGQFVTRNPVFSARRSSLLKLSSYAARTTKENSNGQWNREMVQ